MCESNAAVIKTSILLANPKNRVPNLERAQTDSSITRTGSSKLNQSSTHTTAGSVVDAPSTSLQVIRDQSNGTMELLS